MSALRRLVLVNGLVIIGFCIFSLTAFISLGYIGKDLNTLVERNLVPAFGSARMALDIGRSLAEVNYILSVCINNEFSNETQSHHVMDSFTALANDTNDRFLRDSLLKFTRNLDITLTDCRSIRQLKKEINSTNQQLYDTIKLLDESVSNLIIHGKINRIDTSVLERLPLSITRYYHLQLNIEYLFSRIGVIFSEKELNRKYQPINETLDDFAMEAKILFGYGKEVSDYGDQITYLLKQLRDLSKSFHQAVGVFISDKQELNILKETLLTYMKEAESTLKVSSEARADSLKKNFNWIPYAGFLIVTLPLIIIFFSFLFAKSAYKSLKITGESEAKYRTLIENLPQQIYVKDKDFVYVSCNDNFARFLDKPSQQLIGKTDNDLFPDDVAAQYQTEDARIMGSGQVEMFEQLFMQSAQEMIIQVVKTPLRDTAGEVVGVLGIFWDITDHKQAEIEQFRLQRELQQSQKMEALGQLTGGIAHDFNNILGIILGYTELALNRCVHDGQDKLAGYLRHVEKAGGRAKELVAQMLTFSRSEAREDKPLQLQPLVEEDLKMLRSTLPAGIEIQTEIEEGLPDVLMDQTQLNQLLMNLCTNARDAMEGQGTLTILLGWAREMDTLCAACGKPIEGDWIELFVTDTGSGIKPNVLEHIFNPFYTTKDVGKGTGMGLSVIHGIVRSLGGHILVATQPGKGTSFRLLFPPVVEETPDAPEANPSSEELPHGHGEQVLVLDDEPDLSRFVGDLLASYGYRTTVLCNSQEALERFKENPDKFDLLITDQTMPGMSGVELVKTLRITHPELPVILNTGFSEDIDSESAVRLNIRYLEKPIRSERLLQVVGELLQDDRNK